MIGFAITYIPSGAETRKVLIARNGQYHIYHTYAEAAHHLSHFLPRLDSKEWPQDVKDSMRVTEITAHKAK